MLIGIEGVISQVGVEIEGKIKKTVDSLKYVWIISVMMEVLMVM